jgi:predicted tellurium resistance membrane protein TerC
MKHSSWIIYVGAGILGEVAAKMILEDNFIQATIGEVPTRLEWEIRIGLAAVVVVIAFLFARRSEKSRIRVPA